MIEAMTTATRTAMRPRWVIALLAAVLAVAVGLFTAGPASALPASAAETRVGASAPTAGVLVGSSASIAAGQRLGNDPPQPGIVVATGVAAKTAGGGGAGVRSLFHYTDEAGQSGILGSQRLNPSLRSINPADARYGNGQYLSDIAPGTYSNASLSSRFIRNPYQGARFSHYVEVDVSGLNVVEGRPGVFVVPNEGPLDLSGRILGWGKN